MKILYAKSFKKLRDEYADLGDVKLIVLEEIAKRNQLAGYSYLHGLDMSNVKNFDTTKVTRSAEYIVKYRALLAARDNARLIIGVGSVTACTVWLFKKAIDVSKNNSTLDAEYHRGYDEAYKNIEKYCADRNGEDSWIGDTDDGKHMILRISDEETDDYREFFAALEKEAEEKAEEDATIII